jgi:hypothetical protein
MSRRLSVSGGFRFQAAFDSNAPADAKVRECQRPHATCKRKKRAAMPATRFIQTPIAAAPQPRAVTS